MVFGSLKESFFLPRYCWLFNKGYVGEGCYEWIKKHLVSSGLFALCLFFSTVIFWKKVKKKVRCDVEQLDFASLLFSLYSNYCKSRRCKGQHFVSSARVPFFDLFSYPFERAEKSFVHFFFSRFTNNSTPI